MQRHPGGNPVANLKPISHRCHPILVDFVWELTRETIELPLGCLQGGIAPHLSARRRAGVGRSRSRTPPPPHCSGGRQHGTQLELLRQRSSPRTVGPCSILKEPHCGPDLLSRLALFLLSLCSSVLFVLLCTLPLSLCSRKPRPISILEQGGDGQGSETGSSSRERERERESV